MSETRSHKIGRCLPGVIVLFLVTLGIVGCGPKRPRVYPVKGQFFWNGEPAAGAVVFFHPITTTEISSENPAYEQLRPMGRVEADGSFEVSTYGNKDGAPPGRYRVSLVWTKSTGKGGDDAENVLPNELMNPHKSKLPEVEIGSEPNVLPPFNLKH